MGTRGNEENDWKRLTLRIIMTAVQIVFAGEES